MSDPKDPQRLFNNRTLWLDREGMLVARERFWRAWQKDHPTTVRNLDERTQWEMMWFCAISAYLYMAEGNLGPALPEEEVNQA